MLTACITYRVPCLVPPPERCDSGSAVLAGDHHGGVLTLKVQRADVDGRRRSIFTLFFFLVTRRRRLLYRCRGRTVAGLQDIDAGTLRNSVVVRRAATAAICSSGTITPSSTGTCPRRRAVLGDIRRARDFG